MGMTDLAELSLFLATPAQEHVIRRTHYLHWGRGLTVDGYLNIYEHISGVNLITWVLAPRNDPQTINFLSACETFRRKALVLKPSSKQPEETFAYGVTAVFSPPQYRGHGYAQHMMRLLHWVLAPPTSLSTFPPEWGSPPIQPSGTNNACFSALWSDVGSIFYEKCGPMPNRVGWKVLDPIATVWSTDRNARHQGEVQWLSEEDCIKLWERDVHYLEEQLLNRPPWSSSTRCTFLPSNGVAAFQMHRCKCFLPSLPGVPVPAKWGVTIPGTSPPTYATWITDTRPPPVAMLITRIRATVESFPVLMSAIMEAAVENQVATVEVWNMEKHLLDVAHRLGGHTDERAEHISALAWYGPEELHQVEWLFNEK